MLKITFKTISIPFVSLCCFFSNTAQADDAAELAKKLSNPVADVINMPFQLNYDENIGAAENISRYQLNIQPVVPIKLNENWNVISRTVLPVIVQDYDGMNKDTDWGVGDITQSFFFTPTSGPNGPNPTIRPLGPEVGVKKKL